MVICGVFLVCNRLNSVVLLTLELYMYSDLSLIMFLLPLPKCTVIGRALVDAVSSSEIDIDKQYEVKTQHHTDYES